MITSDNTLNRPQTELIEKEMVLTEENVVLAQEPIETQRQHWFEKLKNHPNYFHASRRTPRSA